MVWVLKVLLLFYYKKLEDGWNRFGPFKTYYWNDITLIFWKMLIILAINSNSKYISYIFRNKYRNLTQCKRPSNHNEVNFISRYQNRNHNHATPPYLIEQESVRLKKNNQQHKPNPNQHRSSIQLCNPRETTTKYNMMMARRQRRSKKKPVCRGVTLLLLLCIHYSQSLPSMDSIQPTN